MSNINVAQDILNNLGGQRYLSSLMNPKMFLAGADSLGIRLKKSTKNKINHIEITKEDGAYKVAFWSLPKDIFKQHLVATHENIPVAELKTIIESNTGFQFQKGDNEKNKRIANTILEQLGGQARLNMMLGLDRVTQIDNGVSFTFKVGANNEINTVEIVLELSDTYTVKFLKTTATKQTLISTEEMVYFDNLIETLESNLQCALIPPRFI